ncbi:MAG: hypothetical protein AAGC71_11950 [Pseudomonadota bacterium]
MLYLNRRGVFFAVALSLATTLSLAQSDSDEDSATDADTKIEIDVEEDPTESGSYEDDKDFIPSKEVSADQPLTYPDDI